MADTAPSYPLESNMEITPESETRRLLALALAITAQHTGSHEGVLVAAVFQRLCYETDLAQGIDVDQPPMHFH